MSDRLDLGRRVALEAGALQRERFGQIREIETKSSAIDLVTDVDRACDQLLLKQISAAFPADGILTEETGRAREGSSGYRWVVDPLDGTTNYAHGLPHFAVSIGLEMNGERVAGVVYDPIRDEIFSGERGAGAERNGHKIQVSTTTTLERSLLATGFSYDVHTSDIPNLEYFARFLRRAQAIRRAGSAALDLSYIACGRFDGFWEMHLQRWDVCAGQLLIEEAGGTISDFDGSSAPPNGERLVASNGPLHPLLLEELG